MLAHRITRGAPTAPRPIRTVAEHHAEHQAPEPDEPAPPEERSPRTLAELIANPLNTRPGA